VYSEAVLVLRETEPDPMVTSLLLLGASLDAVDEEDMVEVVVGGVPTFTWPSCALAVLDTCGLASNVELEFDGSVPPPPEGRVSTPWIVGSNIFVMSLAVSSR